MPRSLTLAALQLSSTDDKERNLARAAALIDEAASRGARYVALPETFPYLGPKERYAEIAEPVPGPTIQLMAAKAGEHGIYILAGSLLERVEGSDRFYNTSVLLGPDGSLLARYRKIHLFDVEVGGRRYLESDLVAPGSTVTVAKAGELTVGLSICYDLRFPELYRELALAGAQIVFVPAAFTLHTGRDHWEVLLRARAIENQVFVVAAAQVGRAPGGLMHYGRSMIVDPWGLVLAQAPDLEMALVAEIDLDEIQRVREAVPALRHRRPEAYHLG